MTDRAQSVGQLFLYSRLAEEDSKLEQFPLNFVRNKSFIPEQETHSRKLASCIYHLVQELSTSNNDQTDLKIISGDSNDLWWPKGSFTKAEPTSWTEIGNKARIKEDTGKDDGSIYSEGALNVTEEVTELTNDWLPKITDDDVMESELPQSQPNTPKLRSNVESYQMLLEQRKEEIFSLQESMQQRSREIEELKKTLVEYQTLITELKRALKAAEKEMALLKQKLMLEREMMASLKATNASKLQMIDQLSKKLRTEVERNQCLLNENQDLETTLSAERESKNDLEKEINVKRAHIEELVKKVKLGSKQLEEYRRQALELNACQQELLVARQRMIKQEEKSEAIFEENESLRSTINDRAGELREKTEAIKGLLLEVDELKVVNEKVEEGTKALVGKQRQLLLVNAELMKVNISLGIEKTHVEKTMMKLESTHRRVLTDLKTMLTTFRKQLVAKFKESEDLRRKLRKNEAKLAELMHGNFSPHCCPRKDSHGKLRQGQPQAESPSPLNSSRKKKIKKRSSLSLCDCAPINANGSESSCQELSEFGNRKSIQFFSGYSDRGDNSSIDGHESIYTRSSYQLVKKPRNNSTQRGPHLQPFIKPLEECANFLSQVNRNEMSKTCNVHSPFLNLSPALINLGLSHLISQMERVYKTDHREGRLFCDQRFDVRINGGNSDPPRNSQWKDHKTELASERKCNGDASNSLSLATQENDGTVFEMVSRLCSNLYGAVSKMMKETSV